MNEPTLTVAERKDNMTGENNSGPMVAIPKPMARPTIAPFSVVQLPACIMVAVQESQANGQARTTVYPNCGCTCLCPGPGPR